MEEADIPTTFDREIVAITPESVELMIRRIKKPKSMVPGDLPPVLVNELAKECSVPLAAI